MKIILKNPNEEPEEKKVNVWLESDGNGGVLLKAQVEGTTDGSYLIYILPKGISRCAKVSKKLGFELDTNQCIKIID